MSTSIASFTVLAVDPGDCNAGWSVLSLREGLFSVIAHGVCQFKSQDDILDKIAEFRDKVWKPYKNLGWDTLIIEDQPYIPNANNGPRNFRCQQFQLGVEVLAMTSHINLERVSPRGARTDLGICSGNYHLNKELSIEFVSQKLGTQDWKVPPDLLNHVADSIMIGWWFFSKKLGQTIRDPSNNGQSLNPVWIPPERWTKQSPPNRNVKNAPPLNNSGSRSESEQQRTYSTVKPIRKLTGRGRGKHPDFSIQN